MHFSKSLLQSSGSITNAFDFDMKKISVIKITHNINNFLNTVVNFSFSIKLQLQKTSK